MSGLAIAVSIAALLSVVVYGGALAWWAPRREAAMLAAAAILALPLAPLAYHLVRVPLDAAATMTFSGDTMAWLRPLYAPLTEEPAKLLPLLLPWLAQRVTGANAARVGVALGLGFGIGEIALIADLIQAAPDVVAAPWPALTGFISERYMVCLIHGTFTATALTLWRGGSRWLAVGLAVAMALHLLGNLPLVITPALVDDPATRAAVMGLWVIVFWSGAIVGLIALARRAAPTDRQKGG